MKQRAARLLGLYLGVLLACSACASQPTRSAEQRYLHALEDANRVYETALTEAGRAHADGVLTDEQLATVRTAGQAAEQSLRAARASFEAWLTLQGADGGELDRAMAALQVALAALLEAQHGAG